MYRPPRPEGRRISFKLDEESVELARECAADRGVSLAAWLAFAARQRGNRQEALRDCDEFLARFPPNPERERRAEEWVQSLNPPKLVRYEAVGPYRRVSTAFSERWHERIRENARHAGLSVSEWLARAVWDEVQLDPGMVEVERRSGRLNYASERET